MVNISLLPNKATEIAISGNPAIRPTCCMTVYEAYTYYGTILYNEKAKNTMNWIEIIEIRVLYKTKDRLETELQGILTEINKEAGYQQLKIYSRVSLETDFVILIMNSSNTEKNGGSQMGIRLNEGLREFGMVNYSKWNEFTAVGSPGSRSDNRKVSA